MTCKPCRVTFEGVRYEIGRDGSVRTFTEQPRPVDPDYAKLVRAEASRQRRNRNARERSDAMRSLGLVKTPYGWE